MEAENLKLQEENSDLKLAIANLEDENANLTFEVGMLPSEVAVIQADFINTEVERLQEIRDRTLASLKLGKQSSSYKTVRQVLDRFIEKLNE